MRMFTHMLSVDVAEQKLGWWWWWCVGVVVGLEFSCGGRDLELCGRISRVLVGGPGVVDEDAAFFEYIIISAFAKETSLVVSGKHELTIVLLRGWRRLRLHAMVTMVLLPEKKVTHKLVHVEDNELLLTTLEPYATTTLIELARQDDCVHAQPQAARKRKIFAIPQDNHCRAIAPIPSCAIRCVMATGSWTKLAWSVATWTLVVCLVLARSRKESLSRDADGEQDAANQVRTQDLGSCATSQSRLSHDDRARLSALGLDGNITFSNTSSAASDFGLIRFSEPGAVVYPKSVRDIETVVRAVQRDPRSGLTLAAKGHGHSVHGQAQVHISLQTMHICRILVLLHMHLCPKPGAASCLQ